MSCSCYRASGYPDPDCSLHGVRKGGRKPKSKGKGNPVLRYKSEKQDARDNGWLRAIVYGRLLQQEWEYKKTLQEDLPDIPNLFYCEGCGKFISEDLLEALQELQPCHRTPRKEGKGVRFYSSGEIRDIGLDEWDNIYAGCEDCNKMDHYKERSNPEWSK